MTNSLSEEGEVAVSEKPLGAKPWYVIKGVFMNREQLLKDLLYQPDEIRETIVKEIAFIDNVIGKDIGYLVRKKEAIIEEVIAIIKVYYEPNVTAIYPSRIYPR